MTYTQSRLMKFNKDLLKQLNKEKLKGFMQNQSYLIVAMGGYAYLKFILNWVEYLKRLDIKNYLIFALDKELYNELIKLNINAYPLKTKMRFSKESQFFRSPGFNKIMHIRVKLIQELLKLGINVLFSDVDTVWLKNPIKYMDIKNQDMCIQSNDKDTFKFKKTTSLFNVNGGFYHVKGNEKTTKFFEIVLNEMLKFPKLDDQACFNQVIKNNKDFIIISISGSKTGSKDKLHLNILDPLIFPNGSIYFHKNSTFKKFKVSPAMIHANWINGIGAKIDVLKEFNLWFEGDDWWRKGWRIIRQWRIISMARKIRAHILRHLSTR